MVEWAVVVGIGSMQVDRVLGKAVVGIGHA